MGLIESKRLLSHIRMLSSDVMEGRGPGTRAEPRVIDYVTGAFAASGLEPGHPAGGWIQAVELVGFTGTPTMEFTVADERIPLVFRDDFVAVSRQEQAAIDLMDSPLVFVGYGVTAPEYGWDDFKHVDVRGRTVVVLVNDPPVPDPHDPSRRDPAMFHGTAMTYYGRWTYKLEEASRRGAAGAIIVHQTGPAGYPWGVVADSWSGENMDAAGSGAAEPRVRVESWITENRARELFQLAGHDFDTLQWAACARDFEPVVLEATVTCRITNAVRRLTSHNIIARLPGADPAVAGEYVLFSAHWDHLGVGRPVDGDPVYHGAIDNASGVAAILELARAFKAMTPAPRRTLLFLATTAEEKGLLGARYYASHPLYPLERTLADFNIDGINPWGLTTDVSVIGRGNSTLEDVLESAASTVGRTLSPDPEPEKGFFYRADHFEMAKRGVPALYLESGVHFVDRPADYGAKKREEFTSHDYHKPSDVVKPDWDLRGAVADLELLLATGRAVADGDVWPEWNRGNEFRAIREAMLRGGNSTSERRGGVA